MTKNGAILPALAVGLLFLEMLPMARPADKDGKKSAALPGVLDEAALMKMKETAQRTLPKVRQSLHQEEAPGAGALSLGQPLPSTWVGLNDLLNQAPGGGEPVSLLHGSGESVRFPVIQNDSVVSSISCGKWHGEWKTTAYGDSAYTKLLTTVRKNNADAEGVPVTAYFTVTVTAPRRDYLAFYKDNKLFMVPIMDDPVTGFKAAQSIPAGEVFSQLRKIAEEQADQLKAAPG
ncbi:MAG: hypothetical protein JO112_23765 [Planctomycetes bacterium]|nr:hypothetical protein [Planctomycetota bacterium]